MSDPYRHQNAYTNRKSRYPQGVQCSPKSRNRNPIHTYPGRKEFIPKRHLAVLSLAMRYNGFQEIRIFPEILVKERGGGGSTGAMRLWCQPGGRACLPVSDGF